MTGQPLRQQANQLWWRTYAVACHEAGCNGMLASEVDQYALTIADAARTKFLEEQENSEVKIENN